MKYITITCVFIGSILAQVDLMQNDNYIYNIMLETDSPYLTPVPNRGKRNEPYMVKYVAKKVAEIKNISIEDVANITSQTANNFFEF